MKASVVFVVGATGNQGGGVARALLGEPGVRVRCLTRKSAKRSPEVAALAQRGAEIVVGTLEEPSTYRAALRGCSAAFLNTTHDLLRGGPAAEAREAAQGIAFVDAAIAAGVPFLVYSTLPAFPGNREAAPKQEIEAHALRACAGGGSSTASATAFARITPTYFYENYISVWPPTPGLLGWMRADGDPLYFWMLPHPRADANVMAHVCMDDLGGVVRGILKEGPATHHGRHLAVASEARPLRDYLRVLGEVLGRPVRFAPLSKEQFRRLPFQPALLASFEQYADPAHAEIVAAFLRSEAMAVPGTREARPEAQPEAPAHDAWAPHLAECRRLHPGVRSFETWAREHAAELRAFHPTKLMLAWMARYAIAREALGRPWLRGGGP